MVVGWRATVSGARGSLAPGVLAGDAACSLAMRSSARFPASHFNRHRHQQIVEGGFKGGRDSEGGGKAAPRFGAGNLEPIRRVAAGDALLPGFYAPA